ncbi:MAG: hypothetical protein ACREP7_23485, partial [Lysobacter sp.]
MGSNFKAKTGPNISELAAATKTFLGRLSLAAPFVLMLSAGAQAQVVIPSPGTGMAGTVGQAGQNNGST